MMVYMDSFDISIDMSKDSDRLLMTSMTAVDKQGLTTEQMFFYNVLQTYVSRGPSLLLYTHVCGFLLVWVLIICVEYLRMISHMVSIESVFVWVCVWECVWGSVRVCDLMCEFSIFMYVFCEWVCEGVCVCKLCDDMSSECVNFHIKPWKVSLPASSMHVIFRRIQPPWIVYKPHKS